MNRVGRPSGAGSLMPNAERVDGAPSPAGLSAVSAASGSSGVSRLASAQSGSTGSTTVGPPSSAAPTFASGSTLSPWSNTAGPGSGLGLSRTGSNAGLGLSRTASNAGLSRTASNVGLSRTASNDPSGPGVFSRLSSFFHLPDPDHQQSHPPHPPPPKHRHSVPEYAIEEDDDIFDDYDGPVILPPEPEPPDRRALKVLVVTWNMGDALPKGDLAVLLGDVPPYAPDPSEEDDGGIPSLPVENAHPYHVVVFAAQECPTIGVPRGLGAGLRKGVGLKAELAKKDKDGKEIKEEKKEGKDKDKDKKDVKEAGKETKSKDGTKETKDVKGKPGAQVDPPPANGDTKADTRDVQSPEPNGTDSQRGAKGDSSTSTGAAVGTPSGGEKAAGDEARCDDKRNSQKRDDPLHLSAALAAAKRASKDPRATRLLYKEIKQELKDSLLPPAAPRTPVEEDAPGAQSQSGHRIPGVPAVKGWSSMLEEWLCAGPPEKVTPTTLPQRQQSLPPDTENASLDKADRAELPRLEIPRQPVDSPARSPEGAHGSERAAGPGTSPTASRHGSPGSPWQRGQSKSRPLSIPNNAAANNANPPPSIGAAPSASHRLSQTMNQQQSYTPAVAASFDRPLTDARGSAAASSAGHLAPPEDRLGSSMMSVGSLTSVGSLMRSPMERGLVRSASGRDLSEAAGPIIVRQPGAGPYVNIVKERLLGLYMSVFVYKGCEHLVQGFDKDFVTAGLAGGRFGNKGGIGISLNIGGHRLLFVNAHLAAHTERNDARLANIGKIKSELRLDTFLDPGDPRASLEDITDRFDTTFWCGDLNFRVDISQLHAKWLLEQKKYQDALMFDQLRTAMADVKTNPLPGFQEADITFMPTFKYDVWKSMRATNKELRRSLRRSRARTMERHDRASIDLTNALEGVPEDDIEREGAGSPSSARPDSGDNNTSPRRVARDSTYLMPETPIMSPDLDAAEWQSQRSSLYADENAQSFPDSRTRPDSQVIPPDIRDPRNGDNDVTPSLRSTACTSLATTSAATGMSVPHGLPLPGFETKSSRTNLLKEKSRKLMSILSLGRRTPASSRAAPRSSTPADSARRTSLSSFRSFALSEDERSVASSDSGNGCLHNRGGSGTVHSPLGPFGGHNGNGGGNGNGNGNGSGNGVGNSTGNSTGNGAGNGFTPSPFNNNTLPNSIDTPPGAINTPTNGTANFTPGSFNPGSFNPGSSSNGTGLSSSGGTHNLSASVASSFWRSGSPTRSPPRRPMALLRTVSGRSLNIQESTSQDEDEGGDVFDDTVDYRVGVYDTSKKQRIPSWCDRVLWKTHIIPDVEPMDHTDFTIPEPAGRFYRLSHALSNFGDHFRRRSAVFDTASAGIERETVTPVRTPVVPTFDMTPGAPNAAAGVHTGPSPAPSTPTRRNTMTSTATTASPETINDPLPDTESSTNVRPDKHPRHNSVPTSLQGDDTPARNRSVTFTGAAPRVDDAVAGKGNGNGSGAVPPSPVSERRVSTIAIPRTPRRSSTSHADTPSTPGSPRRATLASIHVPITVPRRGSMSRRGSLSRRKSSGDGLELRPAKSTGWERSTAERERRAASHGTGDKEPKELNVIAKFLRDLPGRLPGRLRTRTDSDDEWRVPPEAETRRRHLVGEVEVLHYGTIDDAGMRQLEGRSDHRPAIFAAAVYVD